MAEGYIQLWEKILESYVWQMPCDQRVCTMTLFLLAARGTGVVTVSLGALAIHAGVSRQTVRTTIDRLRKGRTITTKPTRNGYTVTVRNYALYNPIHDAAMPHATLRLPPGPKPGTKPAPYSTEVRAKIVKILGDLNVKAGRHFKANPTNGKHIAARLRDGYTTRDLMLVTWDRWVRWRGTDLEEYLRPSTLFGPEKFEEYYPQAAAHVAKLRGEENKPRAGEQLAFLDDVEPEELE